MTKDEKFINGLTAYNVTDPLDVSRLDNDLNNAEGPLIIKMTDEDSSDFTVGVALPKRHPSSIGFLRELDDYNNTGKDIYDQIDLCRLLYKYEGIVGTVVDKFIDFSINRFKVENVKNKEATKLIDYFLANLNKGNNNICNGIEALNRSIALDYYVCGNCFLYTKWSNIMMDGDKKVRLPMSISTLDPKIIEIPKESVQFGNKIIRISYNKVFNNYSGQLRNNSIKKDILSNVPTKVRNKFKNEKDLELDPSVVYHIKRKGTMYSGWGVPFLTRCFSAIASKRKLRILDDSTVDGLINSITVFKIGDPKNEATLKPSRLKAFSSLLNNPQASMTLVWSYDVDVLNVSPNGEILNFSDRYKDINADVVQALGFPIILLTGAGDKAGDIWASILFFMEGFSEYLEIMQSNLEDLLEKIMIENGFNDIKPKIRYIKQKIDKTYIRDIILALYDRGLLSKETTLEESGYDSVEQIVIRKEESKETDEILSRPDVPFAAPAPGKSVQNIPSKDTGGKSKNVGTPNPQMKQNPEKKGKGKITEINKQTKKVTPRLDGSSREKLFGMIEYILDNSDNTQDARKTISELSGNIYSNNFGTANVLDIEKERFDDLISKILEIKTRNRKEFKELVSNKIENAKM